VSRLNKRSLPHCSEGRFQREVDTDIDPRGLDWRQLQYNSRRQIEDPVRKRHYTLAGMHLTLNQVGQGEVVGWERLKWQI